jgi:hypothetical protein
MWDTVRLWAGNEHFSCPPGILRMSGNALVAMVAGIRGIRIFEVCLDVTAKSPHFRKPKFESCGHRSQPGRSDLNTTVLATDGLRN